MPLKDSREILQSRIANSTSRYTLHVENKMQFKGSGWWVHSGTWKEYDWKISDKEICGWTSQDVCAYYVKIFMCYIKADKGTFTVEEALKNQVARCSV